MKGNTYFDRNVSDLMSSISILFGYPFSFTWLHSFTRLNTVICVYVYVHVSELISILEAICYASKHPNTYNIYEEGIMNQYYFIYHSLALFISLLFHTLTHFRWNIQCPVTFAIIIAIIIIIIINIFSSSSYFSHYFPLWNYFNSNISTFFPSKRSEM